MFSRAKVEPVPEVGGEAPEFNLPSAQGGQLRLGMRIVRGPVVVAFYRQGNEEDVEYFKALAEKEQEINLASGSVVAIGVAEPAGARNFARASGLQSYVLYDYAKVTSRQWGLLERDKKEGDYARPAVFIVGPDHKVAHAWLDERPEAGEILARISEITGLPKPPEEPEEEQQADGEEEKPKKMSAEEREKIKAARRAARESGESVKTEQPAGEAAPAAPPKMSKEEREKIKAERRAARESGKSVKSGASGDAKQEGAEGQPQKMSKEEREKIKAERRAAREAGKSLKQPASGETSEPEGADEGQREG